MRMLTIGVLAAAMLMTTARPTHGITIGFDPGFQTAEAGAVLNVALVISDLAEAAAPSLSVFDLTVGFNDAVLSLSGVTFGDPGLGDQLDLNGFGTLTQVISAPGTVNLAELSFDSPSDLDDLQAGGFVLASLTFLAVSPGFTGLTITGNALGDAAGDPLTAQFGSASVEVTPSATVVEPASILLLLSGLGAVAARRRRIHRADRHLSPIH